MVPDRTDPSDSGGRLARGWVPSERLRAGVVLAVGLLLVVHPLVGGLPDALGLTGELRYTAYEVTPDGDGFDYRPLANTSGEPRSATGRLYAMGGLTLVDCYPPAVSRACELEAAVTDRRLSVDDEPADWGGYTYHDGLYEQVSARQNGSVALSLRPVSARTVLANISVPASAWSAPLRQAVDTGRVTSDPRLPLAGAMLVRDDSYYIVLPARGEPVEEPMGPGTAAVSAGTGALLLLWGVRESRRAA
jgi:hypothetical protein